MKIYTFFTETHKELLYNFFLPSLYNQEDTDVVIKKLPQDCRDGEYGHDGWFTTMIKKVEYHIQSCKENYGETFIYSDCDVQFLKPFVSTLVDELGNYDIACQDDVHPYMDRNTYCAGFFICKSNDRTLAFFEKILSDMINRGESPNYNDQAALNENLSMVKYLSLSHKFYTTAQTTHMLWDNNYNINIPTDILVHHANWTHGVSNKIKLLNFVREKTK
jgi:hypothetical protein